MLRHDAYCAIKFDLDERRTSFQRTPVCRYIVMLERSLFPITGALRRPARHRFMQSRLEMLESGATDSDPFEKPPHY
jgi:hypothetical protein